MRDWSKPKEESVRDWSKPKAPIPKEATATAKTFPGKGLGLGLAQWAEDTAKGLVSHGAEPEIDIPNFLRHEKLKNKPETNRSPSFNFEQYVDPSQKTQFNVGRYAPDVLGIGVPLAKGATKFIGKHSNKAIGENIVNTANKTQKRLGSEYKSILGEAKSLQEGLFKSLEKEAKDAGMPAADYFKSLMAHANETLGKGNYKAFRQIAPKDLTISVKEFQKKPNVENAHDALVAVKSFVRDMEGEKLVPSQRKAVNAAQDMVKGLNKYMDDTFTDIGKPELAEKFADLNKRYAKEMAPYLETKAIREARLDPSKKQHLAAQDLPHELGLKEGRYFRRTKGEEFPELARNRFIASPAIKYGILGTGASYGTYELMKALLGKH